MSLARIGAELATAPWISCGTFSRDHAARTPKKRKSTFLNHLAIITYYLLFVVFTDITALLIITDLLDEKNFARKSFGDRITGEWVVSIIRIFWNFSNLILTDVKKLNQSFKPNSNSLSHSISFCFRHSATLLFEDASVGYSGAIILTIFLKSLFIII